MLTLGQRPTMHFLRTILLMVGLGLLSAPVALYGADVPEKIPDEPVPDLSLIHI